MVPPLPWTTAWVTGASSGIGREIALQLAAAGVMVAASARSAGKLETLGGAIRAYPLDVTNASAVAETVNQNEMEMGPIGLAVLGAGTYAPVAAQRLDLALFHHTVSTNYLGVVNCVSALAPRMLERRQSHLSWIASVAGYAGLQRLNRPPIIDSLA